MSTHHGGLAVGWALVLGWVAGCAAPPTPLDEMLDEGAALERGAPDVRGRRVRHIDNTRDLQRYIGEEHTVLLLATRSKDPGGAYVIPKCATRAEEGLNPNCGQLKLGYGSALVGALVPEMDGPVPTGEIARPGPRIDCSALTNPKAEWDADDGNGWKLACLLTTSGVVWGVEIDNGDVDPQNTGEGSHRNGIQVDGSDGPTLIGRTLLTDVRRGVFHTANTDVTVWEVVVHRTELAGLFSINADVAHESPPKGVNDSLVSLDASSVLLSDIGLWSVIMYWGIGGDSNDSYGGYRDLVIDAGSTRGFLIGGNTVLDEGAITNSTAFLEVDDSRVEARDVGFQFQFNGPGSDADNAVVARVTDTVLANALGVPVIGLYVPWARSSMLVGMSGNTYADDGAGAVKSTCVGASTVCTGAAEPRFRLAGTREAFLAGNDNFDVSTLTDAHFSGGPLP